MKVSKYGLCFGLCYGSKSDLTEYFSMNFNKSFEIH